jgi:hypothetical protein
MRALSFSPTQERDCIRNDRDFATTFLEHFTKLQSRYRELTDLINLLITDHINLFITDHINLLITDHINLLITDHINLLITDHTLTRARCDSQSGPWVLLIRCNTS